MNYIYAYVKDGQVTSLRPTAGEIPEDMWEKKGLLPYEKNVVRLPQGEDTEIVEGYDVQEDKVIETIIQRYYVPTLAEYKQNKIQALKGNTRMYVESIYSSMKQTNGALGLLFETEFDTMKAFIQQHRDEVNIIETRILSATTKDEVDLEPDNVKFPEVE